MKGFHIGIMTPEQDTKNVGTMSVSQKQIVNLAWNETLAMKESTLGRHESIHDLRERTDLSDRRESTAGPRLIMQTARNVLNDLGEMRRSRPVVVMVPHRAETQHLSRQHRVSIPNEQLLFMVRRSHVLECLFVDKLKKETGPHGQHLQDEKTIANMLQEMTGMIDKTEGLSHRAEMLLRHQRLYRQGPPLPQQLPESEVDRQ